MPHFDVTCYWAMSRTIRVEADDERSARAKAEELSATVGTETGDYVADSFEVGIAELVRPGDGDAGGGGELDTCGRIC